MNKRLVWFSNCRTTTKILSIAIISIVATAIAMSGLAFAILLIFRVICAKS